MTAPLVSCIVPVFNGEEHLAACLDSILAQTHRRLEVVVVDDGSTDRTPEIMTFYGERIVPLRQSQTGPTTARNRGLQVAQGEYLSFLDADDLWLPTKVERQLLRFRERPELSLSVTLVQNFMNETAEVETQELLSTREEPVPGYSVVSLMARREAFDLVGPFDERLQHAADTDWFLRADERGLIRELMSEVLVRRRIHVRNRSRSLAKNSQGEYLHLLKDLLDRRRKANAAPSAPTAPSRSANS